VSSHIRVSARALVIENGSVLLVEYFDSTGLHFNLPGGGVEPGESLAEAMLREVREETSAEVEPGPLLWVVEYEPGRNRQWGGPTPALSFIFAARLKPGRPAHLPETPDTHQTGVRWVPLANLAEVELLPHIANQILAYAASGESGPPLLEEPIQPERVKRYLKGEPE
jgi:8-oxo-dGTP diphosphatase